MTHTFYQPRNPETRAFFADLRAHNVMSQRVQTQRHADALAARLRSRAERNKIRAERNEPRS